MNVDVDAPLIERVKRGDTRAFEMLVVKYQRRIERLIGRMVRDVDLVPDIAQESFIRAYRAIPQFRGDSAFYTWLYRIAVNTAKKALMELKRDPLVFETALASRDEDDETSRVENELSDGETPESILASKQIAGAVNAAIEALSEDLRQAIVLREIEGLSYEEIAEVDELPDRYRAFAHLSGARGHRTAAQADARRAGGRPVVTESRRVQSASCVVGSVMLNGSEDASESPAGPVGAGRWRTRPGSDTAGLRALARRRRGARVVACLPPDRRRDAVRRSGLGHGARRRLPEGAAHAPCRRAGGARAATRRDRATGAWSRLGSVVPRAGALVLVGPAAVAAGFMAVASVLVLTRGSAPCGGAGESTGRSLGPRQCAVRRRGRADGRCRRRRPRTLAKCRRSSPTASCCATPGSSAISRRTRSSAAVQRSAPRRASCALRPRRRRAAEATSR